MSESDAQRPQRRHLRVAVHVPVRVSTIDPETDPRTGRPFFRASREYCANLSAGGAFIRTRDPLSPGHRVLVEIHMPESDPIETIGRVAWAKTVLGPGREPHESGVGVEFLGASGDALVALERWLGAHGSGSSGGESPA
jgi:Tfp pilus assembly protein PilZ